MYQNYWYFNKSNKHVWIFTVCYLVLLILSIIYYYYDVEKISSLNRDYYTVVGCGWIDWYKITEIKK